jgi:hypothetical protein
MKRDQGGEFLAYHLVIIRTGRGSGDIAMGPSHVTVTHASMQLD